MRLISQDGTIDVPYERFVISVNMQNKGEIIAWTGSHISDDECIVMAVYSSYAKAQKAMEMLQNDYYDHVAEKTYHKGAYYIHPYFRFPADEDVEV